MSVSPAVEADAKVVRFRLAVAKSMRSDKQRQRLAEVIEHLESWAEARVSMLHDGERAAYVLVEPARPVRLQAAKDIATTCPYYVPKSFKALA